MKTITLNELRNVTFAAILVEVFFMIIVACSYAGTINMEKIIMIESSGNPMAHNKKDDSRGLFQITPICLKEWNNFHPNDTYSMDDLWDVDVNTRIANWYMNNRIPKMIAYFGKEVTDRNIIIAWNAGISYVAHDKKIPSITERYLRKYFK